MEWLCRIPPENIVAFKFGGFAILGLFLFGLLSGRAIFRSSRVYRADNPMSYWSMQIMYLLFACWALYPVYIC